MNVERRWKGRSYRKGGEHILNLRVKSADKADRRSN